MLGPLAGQYLGDMGADVIKIEPPEGDLTRVQGPRRSDKMSALFVSCNRNKRSVVLDLKSPEDREALWAMVRQSDVLIHSIRTQAAEKIGLTYAALSAINPGLVYCHVKGFSDEGVYAGKPAYDDIIQALSGLAALQSAIGGAPRYVPSVVADKLTGVHAAYAVVLGLYHKLATGRGQAINVPMFETLASFNMIEHLWGGAFEPHEGVVGYPTIAQATRRPFQTADGYLAFLPHTDAHWQRFFAAIGRTDMMADPVFATFPARQKNFDQVWGWVKRELLKRTRNDWVALLADADVPCALVNSLDDLLVDPHLESIDFWTVHDHPTEGKLRLAASPIDMGDSPAAVRYLPPRLGEHTEAVLREFGCADNHIRSILDRTREKTVNG